MDEKIKKTIEKSEQEYSGVATDVAENEKVSEKRVDEMTKTLNNNHAGDNDLDLK